MMRNWSKKAKEHMREQRLTQETLAEQTGKSQAWVSHKLSGRRKADLEDIEIIAKALGTTAQELISVSNDSPRPAGKIPLVKWDEIESFLEGSGSNEELYVEKTSDIPGACFAVQFQGSSMTSPTPPSIPSGATLVVKPTDPSTSAANKYLQKLVIARSGNEITFRKLTNDGSKFYLEPLNQKYDPIEFIPSSDEIVGVVIKALLVFPA